MVMYSSLGVTPQMAAVSRLIHSSWVASRNLASDLNWGLPSVNPSRD